jgi:formylglycine-generating enzyme required for sulfatase activity
MKKILWSIVFIVIATYCNANNITVSAVALSGQVNGSHTFVTFTVQWDNSWRVSAGPQNWDGAWIFVKYQVTGGTGCTASINWNHATLSSTSAQHVAPGGSTIDAVSDGKGIFIYRNANGSGSNTYNVQLRWNYPTDGLLDACRVTVRVFAVEMVHIPTGGFFAGDGDLTGANGRFEDGISSNPFNVTSGSTPNTLGGGGAGSMGDNNNTGQATADDFNDATSRALPASWPNGFNKIYSMKYEISQEQYKEFLNTLTGTQQSNRTPAITVGAYHNSTAGVTTPQARCGVKCIVPPSGATPGNYVCDLNNNGVYDEATGDGQTLAMDWLSTPDLLAYLDWAALRPMTELELEKACRGTLLPVSNEHAWGNTSFIASAGVTNGGSFNELSSTVNANAVVNNGTGPQRCGIFATGSTTRAQAGASYYGLMEMTGNVWEQTVTLGNAAGRSFIDSNGDGVILTNGAANVASWPGANGNNTLASANGANGSGSTGYAGMGFAAGTWNTTAWAQVSDRQYRAGWTGLSGRDNRTGGRGVRTAP